MDSAALKRITVGASELRLKSGMVIYRRGDPCNGCFIVVQGQVKLALHTFNGSEKVVELVGPGGCIGETTIIRSRPHALTAETIAPTRLVHLARAAVQGELERTPVFARCVVAALSDRLYRLIAGFEDCMLHSGTERVIGDLLNRLPVGVNDGDAMITLAVKKRIIASQLNLTQEHYSRILRELILKGLIEVNGRRIRVPDLARLRAHASSAVPATRIGMKRRRASGAERGSADHGVDRRGDAAVARYYGSR